MRTRMSNSARPGGPAGGVSCKETRVSIPRTRLVRCAALVSVAAVALAGLAPAGAAPVDARPAPVAELDPGRALHAAVLQLVRGASADRAAAWADAYRRAASDDDEEAASSSASSGPPEWSYAYSAGDVDGDRREDVVVLRDREVLVRSGKDGRVLVRRPGGSLSPVEGGGAVRLLALDVDFREQGEGYALRVTFSGLDARGRTRWTHEVDGSASGQSAGPAYVSRFSSMPAMLMDSAVPSGGPALLLGSLTGALGPAGGPTRMDLELLSLADGSVSTPAPLLGAGAGLPWAYPATTPDCYVATEPAASASLVSLRCKGTTSWVRPVRLVDPYAAPAGDFDGDDRSDLMLSTFGFEPASSADVTRGTRVLAHDDGAELGGGPLDGLVPIGGDASGDGQPDFLGLAFEDEGFAVRGTTVDGTVLYRRTIQLRGSGSLEGRLGLDVTGDGLGDAFLRAAPQGGSSLAVVIDGRSGRSRSTRGVDALLAPGLRTRGGDLLSTRSSGGRLQAEVRAGDSGRRLLTTSISGPRGAVKLGTAAAADLDGDGRRDLLVVSRSGSTRLTTGVSASGRQLWQHRDKAAAAEESDGIVVVAG